MLFFALMVAFKLRARSAFLTALSLTAYSEFGLIVAAGVLPEYLVPLAIAVSISFVISAPLNRFAHPLYERFEDRLRAFERDTDPPRRTAPRHGRCRCADLRHGPDGHRRLPVYRGAGPRPLGLDADTYTAKAHQEAGRNVLFADAEDSNFWRSCDLGGIRAAILAMDDLEAKLIAARSLRQRGFTGPIVAHALHESHQSQIREAGADYTYLTMNQAGISLAEQTERRCDRLSRPRPLASPGPACYHALWHGPAADRLPLAHRRRPADGRGRARGRARRGRDDPQAGRETGPEDLRAADGYLFCTPENLAALSGAMKEFFDRCYYEVLGEIEGRVLRADDLRGSDGENAARQAARIAQGWRLRAAQDPLIVCTHAQTREAILAPKTIPEEDLARCRETGQALAAGLAMGMF